MIVNVGEAKDRFSELLRRVEDGEEVVIARNGQEIAQLTRRLSDRRAVHGMFAGRIEIGADFDDPLPGFAEAFEGIAGAE